MRGRARSAIALSLGTVPGERRENAAILGSVNGSAIASIVLLHLRVSSRHSLVQQRLVSLNSPLGAFVRPSQSDVRQLSI